ncbi:hypothetical protein CLOM_g8539 [Closterium sp. NIES-68]|nr:hypothetical protein CLOM_g8539 [Closterium sp. NIES-68]GJP83756.1 hypothetical protein CLOP_g13869 [Closterium sp. NIES-67]
MAPPATAKASTEAPPQEGAKSHVRRDLLLQIQAAVQKQWEEEKVFEATAKDGAAPGSGPRDDRFFGNFPYPYMNGLLHLGHAFTLSKVEFAASYHRLRGANVLFPFGFHCTGMPIKACADKLAREMDTYGYPPKFPSEEEAALEALSIAEGAAAAAEGAEAKGEEQKAPGQFKGKKSKAAAKTGTAKYQWDIMRSMGMTDEEIKPFRDPAHWLTYFPPIAVDDLKAFGLGVDWRRSFITTDMNPYYDSFARWHLQTLYNKGKVVKDRRYTIFSPLDGQPCADHDRASGEGVLPQEYTLIKMQVVPPLTGKLEALAGRNVFLAAATLRPETMYGQTNAWVLPDGQYGAFEVNEGGDVFVVTKRSALNLSYQFLSKEFGKPHCLLELTGHDLIGLPLKAPLTPNPVIYALPMLTILTDKGTGVVTSVPSDAPDDYMALQDLKSKPALRAKFNVKDEWVLPFEVIPIINIPEFGDAAAVKVCQDLKIQSQNDKEKLAEAKRLTYLKGFTDGVMLVGELKGTKVQDAKPQIKKLLVERGEAVPYSEPEKRVTSRSGDECVVALTDQWYLTYGETEWRALAEECLAGMQLYNEETRHGFQHTLGWLDRWACSRSFGLGTRIPWDPQFLIESLSDSTVYMSYYTLAHILQEGDIFGTSGKQSIKPDQLSHALWDHLLLGAPKPADCPVPDDLLQHARQEFEYWYPFDLRVSGKDLINNHLTFAIYNHTAMFDKDKWPRGFRTNGHLLLNSEKMSKSTGNFKTIRQAIEEFSSDATRFALADAGDTVDDANFVEETANAAILRLTKEMTWMEEVLASAATEGGLRSGEERSFADRVFENEINLAVSLSKAAYDSMLFREALKTGFFDLQLARDEYRLSCGAAGMHKDLLLRFCKVQTLLLMPICPHYGEHVWRNILKLPGAGITAGWPEAAPADMTLKAANTYLQDCIVDFRKLITKQQASAGGGGKAKGGKAAPAAAASKEAPRIAVGRVFVAEKYGGWQEDCLRLLQQHFDAEKKAFAEGADIMGELKASPVGQRPDFKKLMGQCMGFIRFKKDAALVHGAQALDVKLQFDEANVLRENADLIKRQLQLEEFSVFLTLDSEAVAAINPKDASRVAAAVPGSPVAIFSAAS